VLLGYSHDPQMKSTSLCERNVTIKFSSFIFAKNKMKLLKTVLLKEFRKDVQMM
jgi:hypothetical protein